MATKKDQYIPTEEEIKLLINDVVSPHIKILQSELKTDLPFSTLAFSQGKEKLIEKNNSEKGICKLCFWKTHNGDRNIFEIALRFEKLNHTSGFTGINIKGEINKGIAKKKTITNIYNNNNYPKW